MLVVSFIINQRLVGNIRGFRTVGSRAGKEINECNNNQNYFNNNFQSQWCVLPLSFIFPPQFSLLITFRLLRSPSDSRRRLTGRIFYSAKIFKVRGNQVPRASGDEFTLDITEYFSFHSFFYFLSSHNNSWREKKFVSSCADSVNVEANVRVFFGGCIMCFSVCYLSDVSLLNELYWHLGDISMNMTLDIISITLRAL